jgi:general secretion pathway protein H
MPISAPGTSEPVTARRRSQGFTLIELLVVLTIIGLMSAAVVLAMPDMRGSLRGEAERFAARSKAAADLAVIGSRPVSLRLTRAGYGFDVRAGEAWQPLQAEAMRTRAWGEGTFAAVPEAGMRVTFDSTGLADPTHIVLSRDEARMSVRIEANGAIRVEG